MVEAVRINHVYFRGIDMQVERVERHLVKPTPEMETLCHAAKNLYNVAMYAYRQAYFHKQKCPSAYGLIRQFTKENQADYRMLPAQTAQQVIKMVEEAWKGYFRSLQNFGEHPEKYHGKPKPPRYKAKDGVFIAVFTNQQVRIRDGQIAFPKMTGLPPLHTKQIAFQQVRIVPLATVFAVEVVYKTDITPVEVSSENILAIDLGVGNLATCVTTVGVAPFIVNGKPLRKINAYFNKERARLQACLGSRGISHRIARLTQRRNQKVTDYLHKASAFIRRFCIDHQIGTVIVGHNKGWKQRINLGKQVNQKFSFIPFQKFLQQLQYKLGDIGITITLQNEAHTSKCDHLAGESIEPHETYLGKRVKRGLFQSSIGRLLNADVNGAIGIGIKAVGNGFLHSLLDTGVVLTPIKMNIF